MAKVFLLTGLSGAGKTTLAEAVRERLDSPFVILDGDETRKGISRDLGFTPAEREEHARRCGEIAKLLANQGVTVILALIAPYAKIREGLKAIVGEDLYVIHVDCPLEICARRDPKKNYVKAFAGLLKNYTGVHDAYEAPASPDLAIQTSRETVDQSIAKLADFINKQIANP